MLSDRTTDLENLDDLRQLLMETIAQGVIRESQLQAALESRDVIGQAKGILMEREGIDADQAFAMLTQLSQHTNVKLREVAARVVAAASNPPQAERD